MTYRKWLRQAADYLQKHGIDDADSDAWYLFSHIMNMDRAQYILDMDHSLCERDQIALDDMVTRRAKRIPLQHLLGYWDFLGLRLYVNEHVLIPRPETEELVVEAAFACMKIADRRKRDRPLRILDMCTGSGCIPIGISARLRASVPTSGLSITAADISGEALAVACKNGELHKTDILWVQSDLFENISGTYDVITSNPPYIPTDQIFQLQPEVSEYDPFIALDGGTDGLAFYRKIAKEAPAYLEKGGYILLEIGGDQSADVCDLLKKSGFTDIRVKKDLAGLDRIICGVYDK